MEQQDVAEAIATLQAQGVFPSIGRIRKTLGYGSPRDISRFQKELLPRYEGAPACEERLVTTEPVPLAEEVTIVSHVSEGAVPIPSTPTPEAVIPPPLTLLEEARADFEEARNAENQAHRALDYATRDNCAAYGEALVRCRERRCQAEDRLAALQRSKANLIEGVKNARIALRYDEGALAQAEETARSTILQARRQAEQTRHALRKMQSDLAQIAGTDSVPAEG